MTLLHQFWSWAGVSEVVYARNATIRYKIEPFYFPEFDILRNTGIQLVNTSMDDTEMYAFLTILALDEEEEVLLSYCKEFATDDFVEKLMPAGVRHLQPDARWEIAELLRVRKVYGYLKYLEMLLVDEDPYVRKRAQNALGA